MADRFVINRKEFKTIALTPFFAISTVAVFLALIGGPVLRWISLGVLLMHTFACIGDFAMLSFYKKQGNEEIYSYDDVEAKVSYFFKKKQTVPETAEVEA